MEEVNYKDLVPGKEYIIAHKELFHNYDSFYKGSFVDQYQRYYEYNATIIFQNIRGKNKHGTSYTNRWKYSEMDTFYEIDSINKDKASDDIKYLIDVQLKF